MFTLTTGRFFGLLSVLVVAGAIFGHNYSGGLTTVRPEYGAALQGATEQPSSERDFQQTEAKRLWTIGGDQTNGDGALLYGSLQVKVGPAEDVYVLDLGDLSIKRFSPDGELLRRYGNGKGQGPGEFAVITDFSIRRPGELWVADDSNGRISVFDRESGDLLRTLRPDAPAYRVLPQTDGRFALLHAYQTDSLFTTFDPQGLRNSSFGHFIADQAAHPLVLDGWIDADGAGGFVYAGRYASLLGRYAMDGTQRYLRETIAPIPLPRLKSNKTGTMWVDQDAWPSAWAMSVATDEIHLLTTIERRLEKVGVLDSYRITDGTYLYSRRLPERCGSVVVTDAHLYTVTETSVSKWALAS